MLYCTVNWFVEDIIRRLLSTHFGIKPSCSPCYVVLLLRWCSPIKPHLLLTVLTGLFLIWLVGRSELYPMNSMFSSKQIIWERSQIEVKLLSFAWAQRYSLGQQRSTFGMPSLAEDSVARYFLFQWIHALLRGRSCFPCEWPIYEAVLFENAVAFKWATRL